MAIADGSKPQHSIIRRAVAALFGLKKSNFVGQSNVLRFRDSPQLYTLNDAQRILEERNREDGSKLRQRVEAADFGRDTAEDLAGKLRKGKATPEDAGDCLTDVRSIMNGMEGVDAEMAFRQALIGEMTRGEFVAQRPCNADAMQAAEMKGRLQTERDGRLYAIAMFEALESEWLASGGQRFSPYSMDAESPDASDAGKAEGLMLIFRNGPQSDSLMRWIGDVYHYASPEAFNGFFSVLTDYIGTVMDGSVPDPASEYYAAKEEVREATHWGSVNYADPEAAKAAIAQGEECYRIAKNVVALNVASSRPAAKAEPTPSKAECPGLDALGSAVRAIYALDDTARRMAKSPFSYWTTRYAVEGMAKDLRADLEKASSLLPKKHKAARALIADCLAALGGLCYLLDNADENAWEETKNVVATAMLAIVQNIGGNIERAEIAAGGVATAGTYLTDEPICDPAAEHETA